MVNYGGMGSDSSSSTTTYERSRNAYILYYDRVKSKVSDSAAAPPAADSKGEDGKADGKAGELTSMGSAGVVMQVAAKQRKAARTLRQRADLPTALMKQIWQENTIHWRDRAVFDKAYYEFLWNVIDKVPFPQADQKDAKAAPAASTALALPAANARMYCSHHSTSCRAGNSISCGVWSLCAADYVAAGMVATRFVLQTLAHARDKETFINLWLARLKRLYEADLSLGLWFLQELFNPEYCWAQDYLLGCPEESIRNTVRHAAAAASGLALLAYRCLTELVFLWRLFVMQIVDIIAKVLSAVSAREQAALAPGAMTVTKEEVVTKDKSGAEVKGTRDVRTAQGYATRFISQLVGLLHLVPQYYRSFDPFFRVLAAFAGLGAAEAQFLVREHNLLARLIDLFVGEKSTHPELNPLAVDRMFTLPPLSL
jgi:hypothetical protein